MSVVLSTYEIIWNELTETAKYLGMRLYFILIFTRGGSTTDTGRPLVGRCGLWSICYLGIGDEEPISGAQTCARTFAEKSDV